MHIKLQPPTPFFILIWIFWKIITIFPDFHFTFIIRHVHSTSHYALANWMMHPYTRFRVAIAHFWQCKAGIWPTTQSLKWLINHGTLIHPWHQNDWQNNVFGPSVWGFNAIVMHPGSVVQRTTHPTVNSVTDPPLTHHAGGYRGGLYNWQAH